MSRDGKVDREIPSFEIGMMFGGHWRWGWWWPKHTAPPEPCDIISTQPKHSNALQHNRFTDSPIHRFTDSPTHRLTESFGNNGSPFDTLHPGASSDIRFAKRCAARSPGPPICF